ncbi:MAG: lantibiotic dehydratase family protein, partial [Leadbetterella sp.]|nr:lantibiotic dehydratase family protein [Leadbetterella sp.]
MRPFPFVQFRIPAGKIADIFEKPFDPDLLLENLPFMEALKEASPSFLETLTTGKLTEEHHKTLYKYYSRWCIRCTPFGRFSGVFTADLSDKTAFPKPTPHLHTGPDILEKKNMARLLRDTALPEAHLHLNDSLYPLADKYHLLQYIDGKYRQVSFDRFEALDAVVRGARAGVSYAEAENILVHHHFSKDDAGDFIRELTDEQVLYTGFEFRQSETPEEYRHRLQRDTLPEFTQSYTFTVYPDAEIDRTVIHDILEDVKKLRKFFKNEPNPRLSAFREEFVRRFEGEEIPLQELLDPDTGIPYGTYNLTSSGEILSTLETLSDTPKPHPPLPDLLLDKYITCMASGGNEITLTAEEVDGPEPEENLSFYLFGSLLREGTDYRFLFRQAGGSSAVNLMSRFSLGNGSLAEKLRQVTACEQSATDALLAEVIH